MVEKEKQEEKKEKEKTSYNCLSLGKTDVPKVFLGIILAFTIFPLGAGSPTNPNGYRPSATRTDFRDVQRDPQLMDHIKDLNYVNSSISAVHADHIGIQTYVQELKYVIET